MFLPFSNSNKYLAKSELNQKPSKRTICRKIYFLVVLKKNSKHKKFFLIVTQNQLQEGYFKNRRLCHNFYREKYSENIKKIPI